MQFARTGLVLQLTDLASLLIDGALRLLHLAVAKQPRSKVLDRVARLLTNRGRQALRDDQTNVSLREVSNGWVLVTQAVVDRSAHKIIAIND